MGNNMEMRFEPWVGMIHSDYDGPDGRQIADIAAQMLYRISKGECHINFSGMRVVMKNTDIAGAAELLCTDSGEYTEADGAFRPIGYRSEERTPVSSADAVFVSGLMLYYMTTGIVPDVSDAEFRGKGPAVQAEESEFDELICSLTEINEGRRINADEAIEKLAGMYPSEAVVRFIDKDSGMELASERASLNRTVTLFSCGGSRNFRSRQYFTDSDSMELPYRAFVKDYTVSCRFYRSADEHSASTAAEGVKYGIDIGSCLTRIVKLENGTISPVDEACIPTVKNYGDRSFYFLSSENDAADITDENGGFRIIKRKEAAAEFIGDILKKYGADTTSSALTCTKSLRELMAGEYQFISPLKAMGTAFMYENDFRGKVLLIDAGDSEINICVLDTGNSISEAEWKGETSIAGGRSVRAEIMKNVLSLTEKNYGVSMWRQRDSVLNEAKFSENRRALEELAEKLYSGASLADDRRKLFFETELWSMTGKQKLRIGCEDAGASAAYGALGMKLSEGVEKSIAGSGVRRNDISCIAVTGRAVLIPEVSVSIERAAENLHAKVTDLVWDVSLNARGAAVYAAVRESAAEELPAERLDCDIGIMSCSAISSIPVFRCIAEAGAAYTDGSLKIGYDAEPEKDETKNGVYVLKLYRRDADKKEVTSTYDVNGSAIKYMGEARVNVPNKYRHDSDTLHFELTLNESGGVSVCVSHRRRSAGRKLISTLSGGRTDGYLVISGDLGAEYKPRENRR